MIEGVNVTAYPEPGGYIPPSIPVETHADGSYDFTDSSCAGWEHEQMCRDNHWALPLDGIYGDPGPLRWPFRVVAGGASQTSSYAKPAMIGSSQDVVVDLTVRLANVEEPDRCQSGGDGKGPSAPGSTGKPIDVITGNMYFDQTDISIPAIGPPLAFTRSYNSNKVTLDPLPGAESFGPGWSSSYSRTLALDQTLGAVVLRQDDGVALYFVPGGGSTFNQTYPWNQQNTVQDEASTYRRVFRSGGYELYSKSTGRLLEVADRRGQRTLLGYGTEGRLETITDEASGRSLILAYEGSTSTRVATLSGPLGLIATYGYDGSGKLQSVTYADGPADDDNDPLHDNDPDGGYTFEYLGTGGRLSKITDLTGRVIEEHTYDPATGRALTSALSGNVELLTLDYDSEPFRTKVTSRRSAGQEPPDVTIYEWESFWGQRKVTKLTGPCSGCGSSGGDVQEWIYDTHGRVRFYKDGVGNTTEYVYDEATGALMDEKRPLGHTTHHTYYPDGRIQTRTDPNGRVTTWAHDETQAEFVDTITETIDDAVPPQIRTTVHTYWPNGRLKSIQDPRGKVTSFTYDPAAGDLLTSTDPLGTATPEPNDHVTHFEHDGLGRRTALVDPLNHRTETRYNTRGQVVSIKRFKDDGTPLVTRFFYDMAGRRTKARDPQLHVTDYIYDTYGRLWKVKPPSEMKPANSPTTLYEYDLMSHLWKLTDAEGRTTTFARDGHGRVTKVTYPGPELREEHYTYDGAGRLWTRADRRSIVTTYGYDSLGRLTSKTYSNGQDARSYVYDEHGDKGFMTSAENGGGALLWDYDLAGQVRHEKTAKSLTEPVDSTVSYLYDASGNRSSLSLDSEELITYGYDPASRLEHLWRGSDTFEFQYYDDHQRDTLTLPNGAVTDWGYDALGQLTTLSTTLGNATLAASTYTYDSAGNRLTKTHPDHGETYGYDMEYRLKQVLRNATPSETYTYDKVGNRKTSLTHPTWQYNARNELTSYGAYILTYDLNGNLASRTGNGEAWTYDWNAEGELTVVRLNGNVVAAFDYDPLGRRIQKTGPNNTWTRWLYDGEDILRRTTFTGYSSLNIHGPGIDEPLAEEVTGTLRYFLTDGLGSVLRLVDGQGTDVIPARRYNAFGQIEQGSGTEGYTYTGREWDPETGLYYYRARYYDPRIGRFISEDPIGLKGGINAYRYVSNRPAVFRDPTGHVEVIANIRGHAVTDVETASGSQADTGGGHTNANWSIDVACRCSESGFKAHFTIRVDADVYYYSGPYPYEGRIPNDPSVEDADSARAHEERVHVFGPAQYMKTLLEPWEAESYASPGLCQLYADMAISTAMLAVSYATAEY